MTTKQLASRWFEELWNKKNPDIIAEMMDPASSGVTEGGEIRGPDEFRTAVYEPLVRAFPDVTVRIDGVIAEGNEAAVRWTLIALHQGPLLHVPASGKRVKATGMTWLKFRNGKIVSGADSYNFHGLVAFLAGGAPCASVCSA
jgi:steroid delta-isomerase-like uncharacterized protein